MGWLEGKVALVTGGASGLGRAIVERFIEEGARVAVLDRSRERSDELATRLGANVAAVVGDVTALADNRRAVAEAVARFGRLDCFVGNAGIWDFSVSLADLPDDRIGSAFDELFGINVKGYLLGAKAAYRELAKTRGSIIYTVSNAGFYPCGGGPLYTASKHAVVGLIRQLAYELAPKIRVNGVAPGAIPTDLRGPRSLEMAERSIAAVPLKEMVERGLPLGKLPTPRDYTGSYVLLASSENSSTATGGVIICEGGIGVRGFVDAAGGRDL
ncbi:MAG TPA: 3-(cis-5,6-dihydroxycyclohexa-1,3-dien-1-yl)propanoate dehydrogenase, partial [Candidatus Acidoferrales bacterium]|nr:3-(cis-5,6-dihydroxycyclohexa-1,3-dien-1-yl)propanoate dehydrogenase [Candidatus Acidoferrales bacterium]